MVCFCSVTFAFVIWHFQMHLIGAQTFLLDPQTFRLDPQRNQSVLLRNKRFTYANNIPLQSCFIDSRIGSSNPAAEITIGKVIKSRVLALTKKKPDEDDVSFNLEIIRKFINENLEENYFFKLNIRKHHPELKGVIHFSKHGFNCNKEFCDKYGHGVYGFGVCSPYSCSCSRIRGLNARKCKGNLIFDPVFRSCDIPTKIRICGM